MKAIIPAAGEGTRLYPQTHTKPKAMVRLAGKPILGHLLDRLVETAVDHVVVVVGTHRGSQIVEYATAAYGDAFEFSFPEQTVARGLGHAVYQGREAVGDDAVLVVLGDMLFVDGYEPFVAAHRASGADATVGVHEVADPSHYGVVELADGWRIRRLVEKPADPPSNFAISGLYGVEHGPMLFDALGALIDAGERGAGDEFQLTDALQRLVEGGADVRAAEVSNWYDCGRPDPLLEVNRVLLDRRAPEGVTVGDSAVVVPPVDVGADVVVESSVVGPHVSVDRGSTVRRSIVSDSIVGRDATLSGVNIAGSLVGDDADVSDTPRRLNIGANDRLEL